MLLLELLQDIRLLLVIRRRQPLLLLALVVHHLLDHAPGLAVELAQLRVLGLDLGHVDFWGGRYHVRPPLKLVLLVQVDLDGLGAVGRGGQSPGRLFGADYVGEVALGWRLVL